MAGNLASDAAQYIGSGYVFGGTPAHGRGQWDCSSFINWCAGNDLGMAIPGFAAGSYHGQVHGPVVIDWASWSGCTTISKSTAASGDLVIWPGIGASGHIGVVTGSNQMISALNSSKGTVQTPIAGYGPIGIVPVYRHINGSSTSTLASVLSDPTGCASLIPGLGLAYAVLYSSQFKRFRQSSQHAYRKGLRKKNH
jgi:cell wall-associated NlpC family hydrolase